MTSDESRGVDVLSDVLATTAIDNAILCRVELVGRWGMLFESAPRVNLHIVGRGTCWLKSSGELEPRQLVQGDVVLLPHGAGHTLSDSPGTPAEPYLDVAARSREITHQPQDGPEPPKTILLCGTYEFEERERHPLLSLLPAVIHIPADEADANSSLQGVVRILMREYSDDAPGSTSAISRLVDALFVFLVRAWLARQAACTAGWLGALRDPQIGVALSLIHGDPARPWRVASLANEVGMSRAAFARRFVEYVGDTPLAYLTRWRMMRAAQILRASKEPVYVVAGQVGYESETAFSKAFMRTYDSAPGRYRASHRVPAGASR